MRLPPPQSMPAPSRSTSSPLRSGPCRRLRGATRGRCRKCWAGDREAPGRRTQMSCWLPDGGRGRLCGGRHRAARRRSVVLRRLRLVPGLTPADTRGEGPPRAGSSGQGGWRTDSGRRPGAGSPAGRRRTPRRGLGPPPTGRGWRNTPPPLAPPAVATAKPPPGGSTGLPGRRTVRDAAITSGAAPFGPSAGGDREAAPGGGIGSGVGQSARPRRRNPGDGRPGTSASVRVNPFTSGARPPSGGWAAAGCSG
jgi:hypothetical protein